MDLNIYIPFGDDDGFDETAHFYAPFNDDDFKAIKKCCNDTYRKNPDNLITLEMQGEMDCQMLEEPYHFEHPPTIKQIKKKIIEFMDELIDQVVSDELFVGQPMIWHSRESRKEFNEQRTNERVCRDTHGRANRT